MRHSQKLNRNLNHRNLNHKHSRHMGCSLSHKVLNNTCWSSCRSNHQLVQTPS
jgi:hypothetical protein